MQYIRKTYTEINPQLLYAEVRDFTVKQGLLLRENRQETYTLPDESADFITRGTLVFAAGNGAAGSECLRVHIVGSPRTETKLMIDADETQFSADRLAALMEDIDFIFRSKEVAED